MSYTFVSERGEVSEERVPEFSILVVGEEATQEPDLVRVFTDEKQLRVWSESTPVGQLVDDVLRELERDVLPLREDEAWVEQMQRLAFRRTKGTFKAFAGLLDCDVRDEEVIRLAVTERTPLTPSVFDPILLYDRRIEVEPPQGAPADPRTRMLPVPTGWWPNLSWAGWDNQARSIRGFGLNVLNENNWFGGRSAWQFGFNHLLNLDRIFFDRITSSLHSH